MILPFLRSCFGIPFSIFSSEPLNNLMDDRFLSSEGSFDFWKHQKSFGTKSGNEGTDHAKSSLWVKNEV